MFSRSILLLAAILTPVVIATPLFAQQTDQSAASSRRERPNPTTQTQPGKSIQLTVSDRSEIAGSPRKLQIPVDAKPAATAAEELGIAQQLTAETTVPKVLSSPIEDRESFTPPAAPPESVLTLEETSETATPEQQEPRNDPFDVIHEQTPTESEPQTDNAASVIPPTQKIEAEPTSRVSLVPIMSLETIGPQQIVVNQIANYELKIRNLGEVTAQSVSLILKFPADVQLLKCSQQPSYDNNGDVRIDVGTVEPNEEKDLGVQLKSLHRGDFRIATRIVFSSSADVNVNVTQPKLSISCEGPETLKYGETREFRLQIANSGDGTAKNVIVRCALPEGLTSLDKDSFLAEIGSLGEGQSVEVVVPVTAATTGDVNLEFNVAGDHGLKATTSAAVTILRPELTAEIQGPDVVFLDNEAVYGITVRNPSQLGVTDVRLKLIIPAGLHVTSIDQEAQYDSVERSLLWTFPAIEAGAQVSVHLKAHSIGEGRQIQEVTVKAAGEVSSEVAHDTLVISRSDVTIVISDNAAPVKIGEAVQFTITLNNKGTKAASGVAVQVELPQGLEAVKSSEYVIDGRLLRFDVSDLAANQTMELRFDAVGSTTGEYVVRAAIKHDGSTRQLIAEESVFFYDSVQKRVASQKR